MPTLTYGDATFGSSGLQPLQGHVTGPAAVAQRVKWRLMTHRGEWFADPRVGLPWKSWSRQRTLPVPVVRAYLRAEVLKTPGVERVGKISIAQSGRAVSIQIEIVIASEVYALQFTQDLTRYGNVDPYTASRLINIS